MFSKAWWKLAVTRAVRTMAQVVVAGIGAGVVPNVSLNVVDVATLVIGSGVLSLCTSIAFGLPEAEDPTDPRKQVNESE